MRPAPRPLGLLACVLAPLAPLAPPLAGAAPPTLTLEQANARWSGARVTLRVPVELSPTPERGGAWGIYSGFEEERPWHRGCRQWPHPPQQDFWICFLLEPVGGGAIVGGVLPAGTELRSAGWRFTDPARRRGAYLDLALVDPPGRLKIGFDVRGSVRLATSELVHLAFADERLRLELFDVDSPSERLDPATAMASDLGTGRAATAAPAPGAEAALSAIRLLAVAVDPPSARPGDEIAVILDYALESTATAGVELAEIRELVKGTRSLARFEERFRRGAGRHTTSQPVRIPAGAAPGVYRVEARVAAAGVEAQGSALFEVLP